MKYFDTQHIKNIVLLGATKSGKTTLAETMMYEGGVIQRRGTVEDGNTHSDYTDLEKEKGYSVYTSLLHTVWRDHKINILDTPGNDNFLGEILAGLQHRGIAHIYDAGTFDLGSGPQPYFAMEYVDGGTLDEFVAERAQIFKIGWRS